MGKTMDAKYYTEATLKVKVAMLEEAICTDLKLVQCGKHQFCIENAHSGDIILPWAAWPHNVKDLIVYLDGALEGIHYVRR